MFEFYAHYLAKMKTKAVAYILIYLSVLSKVGVESNFKAIVDVSAGVVVLCACGFD